MDLPRRPDRAPMASINITPLVDVMLVLLIIFLVTASLGQQGITVSLPRAQAESMKVNDDMVTVSIDGRLEVWVNSARVERSFLTETLKAAFASRTKKAILLKADQSVPYGEFVKVVALVKAAGVEQLGMLTESPRE